MDERTEGAVAWLLAAEEPAVRHLTRRALWDQDAAPTRSDITGGPWVSALLGGQQADGGFGGDPYRKWTGAHWRLVSLAELAVPAGDSGVAAAAEHVLAWIVGDLKRPPRVVDGLPRAHASVHGNALGACARLGLAADGRCEPGRRRVVGRRGGRPAVLAGLSLVVDLGRLNRLFSEAQRIAVSLIHDTCAADGCERPFAWCELHHRRPWSKGGRTDLKDAVPLCHFHHQRIHDAGFDHRFLPDRRVRFTRRT